MMGAEYEPGATRLPVTAKHSLGAERFAQVVGLRHRALVELHYRRAQRATLRVDGHEGVGAAHAEPGDGSRHRRVMPSPGARWSPPPATSPPGPLPPNQGAGSA